MKVPGFRGVGLMAVVVAAVASLSCARNHDLEFIQVTPGTETLGIACGTAGVATTCAPTTTFRVIGHYIHPQTTVDVTSEVTWAVSNPDLISFADPNQPNVLFPTGLGCGTNLLVQATLNVDSGNSKIGSATVNINCSGNLAGGGNSTDFGLGSTPSNQTVAAAGTTTYTINVTAVSGNPMVQLEVDPNNLPAQVASFSINPSTITGSGSAILTVTASSTTGTGMITIFGSDSSGAAQTQVNLTVQ